MKKTKKPKRDEMCGWYHFSSDDGFNGIKLFPEGPNGHDEHDDRSWGPFATFGEAKRNALEYFKADITRAKNNIASVREFKKIKNKNKS